ncbi:thiamine-phosphate kinase [Nakamurella sp. DB0629]|uniref:Thiamine-monophosphate kinase n=1 Tax=Nakamurella aerolata TaxID=1656892 RepID=A0A849A7Q3_9ACTN|nr:thiamine-phosphate kinase [Nakamurella aerolata]
MASTPARSSTPGSARTGAAASGPAGRGSARPGQGETLGATGEFAVIDAVTAGRMQPVSTLLGPGDDAAVVRTSDGRVVSTVDMAVEGVHFRTDWSEGEQIGRRAALAAMADVAAMGARPTALLVALGAPPQTPVSLVRQIGDGLHAAAAEAGAGVVGGDLTSALAISIAVTVLGDLDGREPVLRSGAKPGDLIAVCGRIGWAAAGFTVLSRGFRSPAQAVAAFRVPEPPLAAGPVAAAAGATAMVDVSDGLLADLGHIAAASGVSMSVLTAALQVPPRLAEVASALGKDPMSWLLTGGEDHALAATFPSGTEPPEGWTPIGTVGPAPGQSEPAVTVDGAEYEGPAGWDHFPRAGE